MKNFGEIPINPVEKDKKDEKILNEGSLGNIKINGEKSGEELIQSDEKQTLKKEIEKLNFLKDMAQKVLSGELIFGDTLYHDLKKSLKETEMKGYDISKLKTEIEEIITQIPKAEIRNISNKIESFVSEGNTISSKLWSNKLKESIKYWKKEEFLDALDEKLIEMQRSGRISPEEAKEKREAGVLVENGFSDDLKNDAEIFALSGLADEKEIVDVLEKRTLENHKEIVDEKNNIIVSENLGRGPRTKEFQERMKSYGEGIMSNKEIDERRREIEKEKIKNENLDFSTPESREKKEKLKKRTNKSELVRGGEIKGLDKRREQIEKQLEEIENSHIKTPKNREEKEKLENELGKLERKINSTKVEKNQPTSVEDAIDEPEEILSKQVKNDYYFSEPEDWFNETSVINDKEESSVFDATLEEEIPSKTPEEVLEESREKLAREYSKLKEKTLGVFGSEKVENENDAYKIALIEDEYRNSLKEYRNYLIENNSGNIEDSKNKTKSLLIKSVALEANRFYDLKTKFRAEAKSDSVFEKVKSIAKKTIDGYRKMPLKYKILTTVGLFGAGVGAGAVGGVVGTTILSGVFVGRGIQKVFGGAATTVGLEAWIQKAQEKEEVKEVLKEFAPVEYHLGRDIPQHEMSTFKRKNVELDKKLFELLSEKKKKEIRRYTLAGAMGALIGTGAVSKAFHNISEFFRGGSAVGGGLVASESIAGNSNIPESIISKPGDSIWKISERWLTENGKLVGLNTEQKTYVIDSLKDKLVKGVNNPDLIKVGQKIDFGDKFKLSDIAKAISSAKDLSVEQIKNIRNFKL